MGGVELPAGWQVGLIVGGSGTGKTTIAKELFKDAYFCAQLFVSQAMLFLHTPY